MDIVVEVTRVCLMVITISLASFIAALSAAAIYQIVVEIRRRSEK